MLVESAGTKSAGSFRGGKRAASQARTVEMPAAQGSAPAPRPTGNNSDATIVGVRPPGFDGARSEALARVGEYAVVDVSLDGTILSWNDQCAKLTGIVSDDALGSGIDNLLPAPFAGKGRSWLRERETHYANEWVREVLVRSDGSRCSLEVALLPLRGDRGVLLGYTLLGRHAAVATEEVLGLANDSEDGLRHFLQMAPVGVCFADLEGVITDANGPFGAILGYRPADLVGRRVLDIGETHVDAAAPSTDAIGDDGDISGHVRIGSLRSTHSERRLRHREGRFVDVELTTTVMPGPSGDPAFLLVVCRDITTRLAKQRALAHKALHDGLTGLANRTLLLERIESARRRIETQGGVAALLFLDLDQFKLVNDALGHLAGDELLKGVAERLSAGSARGDSVARLGGDEFVVLCERLESPEDGEAKAQRLLDSLSDPFLVAGRNILVTASVGVAVTSSESGESLLREADAAMYEAKEMGRNRYSVAGPRRSQRSSRQLRLASELHQAVDDDRLSLRYQPVVELRSKRIVGFEALLRWEHPTEGLVFPDEFVPLAEDIGLISVIGEWVLREACSQAAKWNADGGSIAVHVNVSSHQLGDVFAGQVVTALGATRLAPKLLVLEVTERAMMPDMAAKGAILRGLRELGVSVAIDDFGTGYSSLAYMENLPVDELKVDRRFVERLGDRDADASVMQSIVNLAHTFGLRASAEGIERPEQLAELLRLGCDEGQGFLWNRPVPAERVPVLLSQD